MYRLSGLVVSMLCIVFSINGQTYSTSQTTVGGSPKMDKLMVSSTKYQQLKQSGQLGKVLEEGTMLITSGKVQTINKIKKGPSHQDKASSVCCEYTPPNTPAILPLEDDDATGLISLPFDFCFYGTTFNSCYIGTNGIVSFNSPLTTYNASGLPLIVDPKPILAPFWADFDFRGIGEIHYEILSNAFIVHWVDGGYFNTQVDKTNTMMLVITDGTSNLLRPGANVGFIYGDMQWTTGGASGGTGGFGGTPATVGVDRGNSSDYIQIGRFDNPGTAYDGAFGNVDQVDWLDNKCFMFDVCNSSNIPPIVAGISLCDTVRLCVGDTFPMDISFLAPEINQTTIGVIDTTGLFPHINVMNIDTGNTAVIQAEFYATEANVGTTIIPFWAFDNATDADTIYFDLVINVDSMPFKPVISGNQNHCPGVAVQLDAGPGFDSYLWSNTSTNQSTQVMDGNYAVTVTLNGCTYTTDSVAVVAFPEPTLEIVGDTIYCHPDSVDLIAMPRGYVSYNWNSGLSILDSIRVQQGTYSVEIVDINGCQNQATVNVHEFQTLVGIKGDTNYCEGGSTSLYIGSGYDTYSWSTGGVTDTITASAGEYFVEVTLDGCVGFDTVTVQEIVVVKPVITGNASYCAGNTTTLSAGPGYDTYSWLPGNQTTSSITATSGTYSVTVSNQGCTKSSDPFIVTENQNPTPVISGNLNYCFEDSTMLSTVNNYTGYVWSPGNVTVSPVQMGQGTYTVSVIDNNGCSGTSAPVTVNGHSPNAIIGGQTTFCPGTTINMFTSTSFASYQWSNGATTQSTQLGAGTHHVTVTDAFGCEDSDTITLVTQPLPNVNFTTDPLDNSTPETPVKFTDLSNVSTGSLIGWDWVFGDGIGSSSIQHPVYSYGEQGTYSVTLTVTTDFGCKSSFTKDYLVIDQVYAYNVITPNGDGKNDFLTFTNLQYYPQNHLEVFDRWGKKVYEKDNYLNDWDAKGHNDGTYYYVLDVEGFETFKGSVTILK